MEGGGKQKSYKRAKSVGAIQGRSAVHLYP
jgi:hypothetical protein